MILFYTEENLTKWKKRAKTWKSILLALLFLSVASAIVLCFFVSTKNAEKILLTIISEFTLSGWIFILLLNLAYLPASREAAHIEHILKEEISISEGVISVSPVEFQIPKSISLYKVTLTDGENLQTLSVNARYADLLLRKGRVHVQSAKGYVTGIEVAE